MCSAGRSSRLIVWCVCASMAVARTYTKVTPYGRMMSSDRAALNMVSIDGYARKVQQQCADATYASGSSTETSATATDDAHDLNGEAAQTIDTADEIRLSNVVDSIATTVNDEAVHSDAVAEKRAGPPRAPVVETSGAQVNTENCHNGTLDEIVAELDLHRYKKSLAAASITSGVKLAALSDETLAEELNMGVGARRRVRLWREGFGRACTVRTTLPQDEGSQRKRELMKTMELEAIFTMFADENRCIGMAGFLELMSALNYNAEHGPRGVFGCE